MGRRPNLDRAPIIAVIGSDGSGKSTLARDVLAHVREARPAALCYLGLGSGTLGNRIKALPLLGRATERQLVKRADAARDPAGRIPGLPTALVIYGYSLVRRRRFLKMLALRRRGVAIVTDRYPQVDVMGFYDGPSLSAAKPGSRAVARLARRERHLYDWMAGHVPDLVIRLNVDVDTAMARKPDHRRALIARKVEATPKLAFKGAPIVDLDARRPYEEVKAKAFAAVDRLLGRAAAAPAREMAIA